MSVAQSNVDYIEQALADTPDDHAWEVNEERLFIELGERAAMHLASFDASGGDLAHFAVMVAWPFAYHRGLL